MQRTQIYLTDAEQAGLQRLAREKGATLSAVIREAVDHYLQTAAETDWRRRRAAAFGLWRERDVAGLDALRAEERFGDWHDAA